MMVVPLFHRHRILTQVAADNVNIIKLLPPLICGQEEIDYFVGALDDVLEDAHERKRTPLRVRSHHGEGRTAQVRQGSPADRVHTTRLEQWERERERYLGSPRRHGESVTPDTTHRGRATGSLSPGASGFIGSAVVRALLARDARCRGAGRAGRRRAELAAASTST